MTAIVPIEYPMRMSAPLFYQPVKLEVAERQSWVDCRLQAKASHTMSGFR
jgi:hypothetical protein